MLTDWRPGLGADARPAVKIGFCCGGGSYGRGCANTGERRRDEGRGRRRCDIHFGRRLFELFSGKGRIDADDWRTIYRRVHTLIDAGKEPRARIALPRPLPGDRAAPLTTGCAMSSRYTASGCYLFAPTLHSSKRKASN